MSAAGDRGPIERQPGGMLVVKEFFSLRELIEILHVRRLLERWRASCSPRAGSPTPCWGFYRDRSRRSWRPGIRHAPGNW